MKLEIGKRYDTDSLVLAGWTEGDGSGHEGYSCWAYFDGEGCYLGPDKHGIEPIFETAEETEDDEPSSNAWDEYQYAKAQVLPIPYLRS